MSFEERLIAEISEDHIQKEIKSLTTQNVQLRSQWIQVCKNHINTFQALGNIDAMIWIVYGLCRSLSYYVHELNLREYISEHINFIGNMLQELENYLFIGTIEMIHENAKKCLNYSLSPKDILSVLHIEIMYSQYMFNKKDFDKSLAASKNVIDYCNNNRQNENNEIIEIKYQAIKLKAVAYMEKNDIGNAWEYVDKFTDYAEMNYKKEQSLGNLLELANAKLNQVILWDKMSVEPKFGFWTIEHQKSLEALNQLYDTYWKCYNFEKKEETLSRLARRIRQTHELIREKGLGNLATPKAMKLAKHFIKMFNDAIKEENDCKHDVYIKKLSLLAKCLRNTHYVDIYFDAERYADILLTLGQDSWSKDLKEDAEKYYEEALQIRYELDEEGIRQNKESYAILLYFYALIFLSKPLSQNSISQAIEFFEKSNKFFEETENELDTVSLSYYSSCCFNLGIMLSLYTTAGKEVGLPLVETAINIMDRLVNNYGLTKYERDLNQFKIQYHKLKDRR